MKYEWLTLVAFLAFASASADDQLQLVNYNNPGLVVDLGVGLSPWPVPMDADGDGDYDLVVSYDGKPSNGTYIFENPNGDTASDKFPVLKDGKWISRGYYDVTPSYVDGRVIVAVRNLEFPDFATTGLSDPQASGKLQANVHPRRLRLNQWRYVDYDGDGQLDLSIGIQESKERSFGSLGLVEPGYDEKGNWISELPHGNVYILRNLGTTSTPRYGRSEKLTAGGSVIDVYGLPSQVFEDFDGDGDLDLVTTDSLDGFIYYRNDGSRAKPEYAAAMSLPIKMDLVMLVVTAIDWDKDGDIDLVVGQEDGSVALLVHTGKIDETTHLPQFEAPRFFQQQAGALKFGALVTPVGVDWDGDGDDDIVAGNSAGYIGFIENLAGAGNKPSWAAPRYLKANDKVIRIMAGPNGSVQGPGEARWGYTTLSVADWDGDGLHDLVVNSIWGKVVWYRNAGTTTVPKLLAAEPIEVQPGGAARKPAWVWWEPVGNELVTQWRTTPFAIDWNKDDLMDLVMLDQEGYLSLFRRMRVGNQLKLLPPERIFVDEYGEPLKLSRGDSGASGRRKLHLVDWDGDGRIDLLTDSLKTSVRFYRNESENAGRVVFRDRGMLDTRELARHTTSPSTVDWNGDGVPDLLVGAEDGRIYHKLNPRGK